MLVKQLHNMASARTWEIGPPQTHDSVITSCGRISVVCIGWTQARSAPVFFEFQGDACRLGLWRLCSP